MLVDLTLACWIALELFIRVRETVHGKGGRARDRGTRILVGISLGAAVGIAVALRTPARPVVEATGVVVMWLGLATRGWAVAALGASFRTTVEVDADQTVVSTGPYRWIRHPSYTGLLLIVAGYGVASGSLLAVVLCIVLPLPAIVRRIYVEEAELDRVLGDAYRGYRARTARLIPRVW